MFFFNPINQQLEVVVSYLRIAFKSIKLSKNILVDMIFTYERSNKNDDLRILLFYVVSYHVESAKISVALDVEGTFENENVEVS